MENLLASLNLAQALQAWVLSLLLAGFFVLILIRLGCAVVAIRAEAAEREAQAARLARITRWRA